MSAADPLKLPQYQITTPEQVSFRYEAAGLVSRAVAWVVDQLIIWALRVATLCALGSAGELGIAALLVALFLYDFGYYAIFELWWAGQTPGKRTMRIRVTSASGASLSFSDVMLRNLLRPLDSLPAVPAVGGLVALVDRYNRRLGDLAADTLVVRAREARLPASRLPRVRWENSFADDAAVRQRILARVTREERDLMLDLMLRRDQLDPAAREGLFRDAAACFRERYRLPEQIDHLSDEQTVLSLALVVHETNSPLRGTKRHRSAFGRPGEAAASAPAGTE